MNNFEAKNSLFNTEERQIDHQDNGQHNQDNVEFLLKHNAVDQSKSDKTSYEDALQFEGNQLSLFYHHLLLSLFSYCCWSLV